jgi:hypothetical protein
MEAARLSFAAAAHPSTPTDETIMKEVIGFLLCCGLYVAMFFLAYCIALWCGTRPEHMLYITIAITMVLGQIVMAIAPRSMFAEYLRWLKPEWSLPKEEKDRIAGTVQEH